MLINTRETYGLVAQILHWITALLIFVLLVLGIYMHKLPIDTPVQVDDKIWLYSLHKTLGILAFIIALVRIMWAILQPRPLPLHGERKFETFLAQTIHWLLYGSIILMPVTGWLHHSTTEGFAPIWIWPLSQDLAFFGQDPHLAEFFGNAHFLTGLVLMGSIALHVAGSLKHIFMDRDQTLLRMLPGKKVNFNEPLMPSTAAKFSWMLAVAIFGILAGLLLSGNITHNDHSHDNIERESFVRSSNADWIVDHEKSALAIEIVQNGKRVSGNFKNWQATITFDPENIDTASVEVSVDIASLSLGNISDQAISKDFLDAKTHPTATFSSQNFKVIGDAQFEAIGDLTLVGQTNPQTVSFSLTIEGDRAFMKGQAEVARLDFDLGQKGFKTGGVLGFTVDVNVELEADRK